MKVVESSDEDSSNEETASLLAKKFRFLKFNKGSSKNPKLDVVKGDSQGAPQGKREKPKKDKNTGGVQCFECPGFGHIRTNCPNFLNTKCKALNASMSNESESDDSKDSKEKNMSFMVFAASMNDVGGPSEVNPSVLVENCDEDSQANSDQ